MSPYRPPSHGRPRAKTKHQGMPRGSSTARGYGYAWQQQRRAHLDREPLCRVCLRSGVTTAATDVDHIVGKAKGGTDDETNLQSLCGPCHSRKTATEDGGYGHAK